MLGNKNENIQLVQLQKVQEKSYSSILIITVLFGCLCYALSNTLGYGIFRIIYSVLTYISIIIIAKVYFSEMNRRKLESDKLYVFYLTALVMFVIFTLFKDFSNPAFSWVTLINNPLALLLVVPIFGFVVGYNTEDAEGIEYVINVCIIFFFIDAFVGIDIGPLTPKVFTGFVLPFVVFNLSRGKYKIFSLIVLAIAAWSSLALDYRSQLLRIIFFIFLYVSLNIFKKSSIMKILVVLLCLLGIYLTLTNLASFLEIFQIKAKLSDNIGSDTRSFLYEEFFEDFKPGETLTGRGFLGSYFSYYFYHIYTFSDNFSTESFNRFSIEVGALELILKGGYILLLLFVAPLVFVIWKGLQIKSDAFKLEYNICIYLLAEVVTFFFENSPSFHIHFYLIFFMAGVVYNKLKQNENINYNTVV